MKKEVAHILIIDDDADVLFSAQLLLKPYYSDITTCRTPRQLNTLLSQKDFDLILLDMNFQQGNYDGKEGIYWLKHLLSVNKNYAVILMTAFGNVDTAVEALKAGGTDFILKPWNNEKFLATISAALKLGLSSKSLDRLEKTREYLQKDMQGQSGNMIGESSAIRELSRMVSKVAGTQANVLILGENGTGKQLIAQQIHQQSERSERVFMHVDLGALHAGLFESELFGSARGAYTDSREERPGRFEITDGGTIFLDEIGNLSMYLQSKLLNVLQNRTVSRLGENRVRPVDVRLICATNLHLYDMVMKNQFRQDLLYRINTVEIHVPPLRERPGDTRLLAAYFLDIYQAKYRKPPLSLSEDALELMGLYSWPGNIRELQHVIERTVIMAEGQRITGTDLNLVSQGLVKDPAAEDLDLEHIEKIAVRKALIKHQGNISKAASDLGLTRAALYRRMEKFNL